MTAVETPGRRTSRPTGADGQEAVAVPDLSHRLGHRRPVDAALLGLLVNSFRDPRRHPASGWWTVFGEIFDSATWTLENYRVVLDQGFANAFANTLAVTIPAVVIPITIAAFAAYAFAWMEFPGRNIIFVVIVGLMVVPLQMALIPILRIYTSFDLNGTFPAVWLAHAGFGLPLAMYLLRNYMGSLAGLDHRVGQDRRSRPLHHLHQADRPAVGAGAGVVRHLPVPLGVERLPGGAGLPGHRPGRGGAHRRAGPAWQAAARAPSTCSRRRHSSRWCSPWWCSSPCSDTSCEGSPPARSRAEGRLPAIDEDTIDQYRKRNWLAIAIGTVVMMFSYFPYARAFAVPEGAPPAIDVPLVGMALAVAPFVFVAVGFVSQNPKAPRHVLHAMGLLLVLGLGLGLLSPVLGARGRVRGRKRSVSPSCPTSRA